MNKITFRGVRLEDAVRQLLDLQDELARADESTSSFGTETSPVKVDDRRKTFATACDAFFHAFDGDTVGEG